MSETYGEYLKLMVEQGYVRGDGRPLKCQCGNEELEDVNHAYENLFVVEYDVKCKKCENIVGYWIYGHWDILEILHEYVEIIKNKGARANNEK